MDSRFQSLEGFRTPWAKFRIPKPGIRITFYVCGDLSTAASAVQLYQVVVKALPTVPISFPIVPCSLSLVTTQKHFRCLKLLIARLLAQILLEVQATDSMYLCTLVFHARYKVTTLEFSCADREYRKKWKIWKRNFKKERKKYRELWDIFPIVESVICLYIV